MKPRTTRGKQQTKGEKDPTTQNQNRKKHRNRGNIKNKKKEEDWPKGRIRMTLAPSRTNAEIMENMKTKQ